MTNNYLVNITADIPYPWSKYYHQSATNEGVAISRALKEYRKDLKARFGRSRRLSEFTVNVRRVKTICDNVGQESGPVSAGREGA